MAFVRKCRLTIACEFREPRQPNPLRPENHSLKCFLQSNRSL
ncbi:hypothetical protein RB12680 [Rhodopirellula baltica SH 1]|uniref:Uncharacterized protein n=1 Tax=Rhodopirellula baltica (strain DSM 10527 / NCIMB 13988 / SH1) TaxID=243090 RepID=Q7UI93_RHOBA|nr:hypothetical protein RB12680 [Rhodopirellula baltica SH 1]